MTKRVIVIRRSAGGSTQYSTRQAVTEKPRGASGGMAIVGGVVLAAYIGLGIGGIAPFPDFSSSHIGTSQKDKKEKSKSSADLVNAGEPLIGGAYFWSGGHGGRAQDFWAKVRANGGGSRAPGLDCSGFLRMAAFKAYGIDVGGITAGMFIGHPLWEVIVKKKDVSREDLRRNDILVIKPGNNRLDEEHIAIVVKKVSDTEVRILDDSGKTSGLGGIYIRTVRSSMFNYALRLKG